MKAIGQASGANEGCWAGFRCTCTGTLVFWGSEVIVLVGRFDERMPLICKMGLFAGGWMLLVPLNKLHNERQPDIQHSYTQRVSSDLMKKQSTEHVSECQVSYAE